MLLISVSRNKQRKSLYDQYMLFVFVEYNKVHLLIINSLHLSHFFLSFDFLPFPPMQFITKTLPPNHKI